MGLIPGSGRSPGGGHGNPLQYPYLGNPRDRGAWWAIGHGVAKSFGHDERLRTHAHTQKQPSREIQRTVFLFSPEDWILCSYLCSFLNLQPDGTYGIKKDINL